MVSRVRRLLPVLVLALPLVGCSDDDPGSQDPSPATSGSEGPPTSSAAPATPSVTPTTGRVISNDTVSMRLPDEPDWQTAQFATTITAGVLRPEGSMSVSISDIGSTGTDELDDLANAAQKTWADDDPAPRQKAHRVVDGIECYVLEARNDKQHRYIVGGDHDGYTFSIDFTVDEPWPNGDELIEQMLASVEIKDHDD